MNLYEPPGAEVGELRFKIYRVGSEISLSEVLPYLQRMGVEVLDERPYEVDRSDGTRIWLYDFGLYHRGVAKGRLETDSETLKELFQDAFGAVWSGQTESDGFNALVISAGLTWRQAMLLRAYAKYMRQIGATFSQEYIEESLGAHVGLVQNLVKLFETRFNPKFDGDRDAAADELTAGVIDGLNSVKSLDQDRIIRSLLSLVNATLRTNYFQTDARRPTKAYVSFKLDPSGDSRPTAPRPKFEIWVYSPRVEGVHLRFGPVARGGLRWSDRREDFRTEILGLVKAQAVKNAVIVPVGAKGGFLPKRLARSCNRRTRGVAG